MDVMLDEQLFPDSLSVQRRAQHWVFLFNSFDVNDLKVMAHMLHNKQV